MISSVRRKTGRRGLLRMGAVALLALTLANLAPPRAVAYDHEAPNAVLRTEGKRQEGARTSHWLRRLSRRECVDESSDGFTIAPMRALRVSPGIHRVAIRLWKRQRPSDVWVRAWRRVDPRTYQPVGEPERPPYQLERARIGGRWLWKVIFKVALPAGHYYIDLDADWPDVDCNPGERQTASWTFHLRADL